MGHGMASIDPAEADANGCNTSRESVASASAAVGRLGAGVILIALAAILVSCLVAAAAALALYLNQGLDGLLDLYQELRFDIPLRTLLGAGFVGVLYVGLAAATIGAAAWRGRRRWAARIAFIPARWQRPETLVIVVVTLAYAAAASLIMGVLRDHRVIVSGETDLVLLATITANLVVLAPLAEELFFRGWLYTGLRAHLPFWPSFLLTTCLFAAIHWDSSHRRILLVLPLAVALGLLREATGSIKPTILLHGAYNLIIVCITLLET